MSAVDLLSSPTISIISPISPISPNSVDEKSTSSHDFVIQANAAFRAKTGSWNSSGEDSYSIYLSPGQNKAVFAVADGVGGYSACNWAQVALFAEAVCEGISEAASTNFNLPMQDIVRRGYEHAVGEDLYGAAALCAIRIDGRFMDVANYGDCGVVLIRNGRAIPLSTAMQSAFNCPIALYSVPWTTMRKGWEMELWQCRYELKRGDIIITGSDGLFDNVFHAELVTLCEDHKDSVDLASEILKFASKAARDDRRRSPFKIEAEKNTFLYSGGGKLDDITLVVAQIE